MATRNGRWSPRYPSNRYAARPRKILTAAAAKRTFARKHSNWVVLYNTPCAQSLSEPSELCPNGGAIQLLSQATLRASLGDSIVVDRLEGHFYFQPAVMAAANPPLTILVNSTANVYMRAGLMKSETTARDGFVARAVEPLSGAFLPATVPVADWTETKWWRLWEHNWGPTASGTINAPTGCCSKVTGGAGAIENGITWAVSEGAIDTSIDTECVPCNEEFLATAASGSLVKPVWHVRLLMKKPFKLEDNDDLSIWFGWENLNAPGEVGRRQQPGMLVWGGARARIEQ